MIRLFFIYFTNQSFFLFLSAQVHPSITEEEVDFLKRILGIPLTRRSWKGLGTLDSLHAFCVGPSERPKKLPLKKESFLEYLSKDLNLVVRLRNGKVLGTHSA